MRAHVLRWTSVGLAFCLLATMVLVGVFHRPAHASGPFDVVVVGAGPGGIAASLQAARGGARVALLEETDWIGGQMTAAGVGTMDEGNPAARQSGIYHEFAQRAIAYYEARGKQVNTCYFDERSLCVDPRVGQLVLREMLAAQGGGITVFTGTRVTSVVEDGGRVAGVVAGNRTFFADVVIDSEPYGDVLAMAGAAYRLGNVTSRNLDANPLACVQDITVSTVIKEYPAGVPAALVFQSPPPGYDAKVAARFAAGLALNGTPLHRQRHPGIPPRPLSFDAFVAYRALPDESGNLSYDAFGGATRTLLNFDNDYPIGDLSARYLSDPALRHGADAGARLLSLQLIYYIQHDLGMSNWSIADDEGYNTSYNQAHRDPALHGFEAFEDQMPQSTYVREGRRVIGVETLTGDELSAARADPTRAPRFADSIAVGYYPMDLHGCRASLETGMDSPQDLGAHGGAFEVPLGIVVPLAVDGLLATDNNVSTSREANGATREQPIAMAIGQAAGALAALAVQHHEAPRDVPATEVQATLRAAQAVIAVR